MKTITMITAAVLATAVFSCKGNSHDHDHQVNVADEHSADVSQKLNVEVANALDPVCEMATADYLSDTIHYQGEVYGFCSAGCKEEFAKNPEKYTDKLN